MSSRKIMIVRHAEKPTTAPAVAGVDMNGNQNPEELIVRGWQRSGALVRFFAPRTGNPVSGLVTPIAIYASAIGKHSKSLRPQHTVLALSQQLNINIDLSFSKDQAVDLAKAIAKLSTPLLVAWEHQDIPTIVNTIVGNSTTCPQKWPGDRFDIVWVLDQHGNDAWQFSQVPQLLLPNDSDKPITNDATSNNT